MGKAMKIWIAIAASFTIVGLILFATEVWEYNWDFTKLSTRKYETNIHEIKDEFRNILVETDTADIVFALSDDGKCKVQCYEEEKAKHSVIVQEKTLVIRVMNNKSWYDYIGINFNSPRIKVYLPKTEFAALTVSEDTGDIVLPKDFQFQSVDISLSTGDVSLSASVSELLRIKTSTGNINLQGVACKNLTLGADTGDVSLNSVITTDKLAIHTNTGDVRFEGSDAAEIFVETDTGNVKGSLLTEKIFIVKTDTGRIDVPKTVTGGKCEITTDTGNIIITIG